MTLARYRLGRTLGAGGMGRVWQARDEILHRDVALKEILLPTQMADADRDALHNQTLREARAAARLNHPGVARIYDTFEGDGRAWIVMEYVPSRSLQQVLDDDGPLPPAEAARIGLAVAEALGAAHKAGVRHRDVKPANVLLADDGRVVLTDFGVAAVDGESIATSSGLVVGSPQYMAPERVTQGHASPAADLWSLGATLYATVEGQSPYARSSVMEIITAIATDAPDAARNAGPLTEVLEGLLRKDPSDRIDLETTQRLLREVVDPPSTKPVRKPWVRKPRTAKATATAPAPVSPAPVSPAVPAPAVEKPPAPAPEATGEATRLVRRRSLHPRTLVAGIVVVFVLAAGAIAWMVSRPNPSATTGAQPDPSFVSLSPSPSLTPSPSSASAPAVPPATKSSPPVEKTTVATGRTIPPRPAGWVDYRDPTGFSVYVPAGWKRSQEGSIVYFRSAGRVLGIDQTDDPQWDPVGDWRGKAEYRVSAGDFPAYHEIHIQPVRYFIKAADWEFTFTRGGVRQHVNNRGVITSQHQAYGFYWQTSDAQWAGARKDLQLVFDSFRPVKD